MKRNFYVNNPFKKRICESRFFFCVKRKGIRMLKSCCYCGKVHDTKVDCGKKPIKRKRYSNQNTFRNKGIWKKKAVEIKERDMYLCRICLAQGTLNRVGLEVHHICPLEEDETRGLENDNLLTVCRRHHECCETGKIGRDYQWKLAATEPNIPPA